MFARTVDRAFRRFQRTGQAAALALVFDRTAPELLRLARHLAARGVAAEDLLQQTFLTAIERKAHWDPAQPLLPWLLGILTNHAHAARRAAQRRPDPARLSEPTLDPADAAAAHELARELDQAIARVPEPYRPVLRLHLQHGLQPQEIARSLELPDGTVRSQLHRGLDQLRRLLPAGIAAAAGAMHAPAALATVRAVVLQRCGGLASGALGTALTLGVLLMLDKKIVIGAAALALVLLPVAFWPGASTPPDTTTIHGAPTVATAEVPTTPDPTPSERSTVATPPAEPAKSAAPAKAPGELLVRVVRHGDQAPLAGIGVAAYPMTVLQNPGATVTFLATDAQGEVVFGDLVAETLMVEIDRAGTRGAVTVEPGERKTHTVTLRGVRVEGQVLTADGTPASAASIWTHGTRAESRRLATTDAAGRFVLAHATQRLELQARQPGHVGSLAHAILGKDGDTVAMTLTLRGSSGVVTGRVLDPERRPLAHALVSLVPDASKSLTPYDRTGPQVRAVQVHTDADGNFSCDEAAPGDLVVTASGADPELAPDSKVVTVGSTPAHIELQLQRGAIVEGRITENHHPLADCSVFAFCEQPTQPVSYLFNLLGMRNATTDADGRYRLVGIVPGLVQVRAVRNGVTPVGLESRTLAAGERLTLDFEAGGGEPFVVQVNPATAPGAIGVWQVVAQLDGTAEVAVQLADARGQARFASLRPGRYRITAYHQPEPGDLLAAASATVEVDGGQTTLAIPPERLRLQPLRGRLVDAAQAPVKLQALQARCLDDGPVVVVRRTTAADGTFAIAGLPMGRYQLELVGDGAVVPLREFPIAGDRAEDLGDVVVRGR